MLVWMLQGAQAHTPPSCGSGWSGVGTEEMKLIGKPVGETIMHDGYKQVFLVRPSWFLFWSVPS